MLLSSVNSASYLTSPPSLHLEKRDLRFLSRIIKHSKSIYTAAVLPSTESCCFVNALFNRIFPNNLAKPHPPSVCVTVFSVSLSLYIVICLVPYVCVFVCVYEASHEC